MDTKGHQECADEVGSPLLKDALGTFGCGNWHLEAFYFGNWLTDVSQIVDPVALGAATVKFKAIWKFIEFALKSDWLDNERVQIENALKRLSEGGVLAANAKAIFFVLGYKKFVHRKAGGPKKMDYLAYKHIFGYKQTEPGHGRYTQYYPHEHMDRYPMEPCARERYSGKIATGTRTPAGRGTGGPLKPHLYRYLVDDIQIAAGLLAEVDVYWAQRMFTPDPAWHSDEDVEWNEYLSKLGHALHAVEDYFVHSNFIELALKDWPGGAAYLPPEEEGGACESSWQIVQKRLKRFQGEQEDNEDEETEVVTGYFDFCDTFFSIRHVYEDVFGEQTKKGDADAAEPWRKLLHNTVKEVQQALADRSQITREEARTRAQQVLNRKISDGNPDVEEAMTELTDHALPKEVRDAFLDAIAGLTERPNGVSSLYGAMDSVYRFVKLLEEPLRELIGPFGKLFDVAPYEARTRQWIDAIIGRFRIGCHSLLAKDYEWKNMNLPELDVLYSKAKDLAKAAHWYIVYVLTRWSRHDPRDVGRALLGSKGDDGQANVFGSHEYVDWLELTEYFLRHPNALPADRPNWWQTVLQKGWTGICDLQKKQPRVHDLVRARRSEVVKQIETARQMRTEAEKYYDSDPIIAEANASGWTPRSRVALIVDAAGFLYDPDQDIIYSKMYPLQRFLGFAYLYDVLSFGISAVIDCETIFFDYKGKSWLIELWKGQYGIETGCEIGVYNRKIGSKSRLYDFLDEKAGKRPDDPIPSHNLFFNCPTDCELLELSSKLYRRTNGVLDQDPIFTRGPEKHWWLTGFKWGLLSQPEDLVVDVSITCLDSAMTTALVDALLAMGYWDVKPNGNKVLFRYDKPKTPQIRLSQPTVYGGVNIANHVDVAAYNEFQHGRSNDPNTIADGAAEKVEEMFLRWAWRYLSGR